MLLPHRSSPILLHGTIATCTGVPNSDLSTRHSAHSVEYMMETSMTSDILEVIFYMVSSEQIERAIKLEQSLRMQARIHAI